MALPPGGLLPLGERAGGSLTHGSPRRPLVTVVARRNSTLVFVAMRLLAAGKSVCASFQENDGGSGYGGGGPSKLPPLLQRMKDVFNFK